VKEAPPNDEMQRTKHGQTGASPLISVLGRQTDARRRVANRAAPMTTRPKHWLHGTPATDDELPGHGLPTGHHQPRITGPRITEFRPRTPFTDSWSRATPSTAQAYTQQAAGATKGKENGAAQQ
jgi:hypothetical protein